jgi:hypothetical protein
MPDRIWASDVLLEIGQRTGIRRAWMLARRRIETGDVVGIEECGMRFEGFGSEITI